MTTPPGEGPNELADMPHLSDVQATDALLDRLGARTPTQDDLADPIVAELARLSEFADASPVPPPGIERLIEVLDGRPLFMIDRGNAAVTEADEPIDLGEVRPAARMIDLTGAPRAGSSAASSAVSASSAASGSLGSGTDLEDDADLAARTADDESAAAAVGGARVLRLVRRPVTKTGWQGAMQQLALPAASVVALLALGGGVSAVVTGDPMSPVYGVSKVASAFGGNDDETKITKVTSDISAAKLAVIQNRTGAAKDYIKSAKLHLAGVANDDTSKELQVQISKLEGALPTAGPSDPPATATPTPAATATSPVLATAAPTPTASAPVTTTTVSPPATTPDTTASASSTADPSATGAPPVVATP